MRAEERSALSACVVDVAVGQQSVKGSEERAEGGTRTDAVRRHRRLPAVRRGSDRMPAAGMRRCACSSAKLRCGCTK